MTTRPDRLRDVVDAVIEALDEGLDGRAVAARAMLSPFHFNRLVRAGIGEAPAAFPPPPPARAGCLAARTRCQRH
jgi:transcriptional regulator GlxA family with amidase domain